MLVLTRNLEQSIIINGNIQVKVLSIRGGKVRLGIVAPEDVTVDREEVARSRHQFFQDADADFPHRKESESMTIPIW